MNLIKLEMPENLLKKYNDTVIRLKKEHPDFSFDPVENASDLFWPYVDVLNECTDYVPDVPDTITNFDGIYCNHPLDLYLPYSNYKTRENNHFWIEDKYGCSFSGVCDNASQALEYFENLEKELNTDFGDCVIEMSLISKEHQPKYEGWRWHKWGPYIGIKNPQCEYIVDEDESIKAVWCFQLIPVEPIEEV